MIIKSLWVKGFGCFKKEQQFVFQPDTVYYVTGRNGSGKSTFFSESFSYLFYGKPYKDMTVKNLVSDGADSCEVGIIFEDGTIIKREKLSSGQNIYIDDEIVTQDKLDRLINVDRDLFFSFVVFGQGFGGFVYFKDADKKDFITKLSLGFVDSYLESILDRQKNYNQEKLILVSEFSNLNSQAENINLKEILKMKRDWDKEFQDLKKAAKDKIARKDLEIDRIDKEFRICEKECTKYNNLIVAIDKNMLKKENELERESINLYEIESRAKEIEHRLNECKERIETIKEKSICPFCRREMSKDFKWDMIAGIKRDLKKYSDKLEILSKEIKFRKEEHKEIKKELFVLNGKKLEYSNILSRYVSDLSVLRLKIGIVNDEISVLKKDLVKPVINRFAELYKKELERFNSIQIKISDIDKQIKLKDLLISGCEFWQKNFRKFKNDVFTEILDSLEPMSNEYLNFLSDGKFGIKIKADIKTTAKRIRDIFEIDIIHKGKNIDFSRLSGGEKRQVALAVNTALIQLLHSYFAKDFNFLVLDEVFENLDEESKEKVVELLEKLRQSTGKTIIMITHDNFLIESSSNFRHLEVINDGSNAYIKEV